MAFRCQIRYSPERTRWAVVKKILHTNRNADGNLYVRDLYFNDGTWNRNYNWLDNDWNSNNPAVLLATIFISLHYLESFSFLTVHSSHLIFFQFH